MTQQHIDPVSPSADTSGSKRLEDMSPEQLDEALGAITAAARRVVGSRPSRVWIAEGFEVEGVACSLEVEISAHCESLDEPGMPSGWRFRLGASCEARLEAAGRGAVFSGEVAMTQVGSDPFGKLCFSRGAALVDEAMERAWWRMRHHQAFTIWREAAEIEAGMPSLEAEGAGARRL